MKRWPRVAIALLLMAALSASLASADLVRTLAHPEGNSFCCCGDPANCHCTANCCNHNPSTGRESRRPAGLVIESSISCRFPTLPAGSLSKVAGPDFTAHAVGGGADHRAPTDPAARLTKLASACQYESLHSVASSRAPPGATLERC